MKNSVYIWAAALSGLAAATPVRDHVRRQTTIGGAVNTTHGPVVGKASELRPNVSEYLGIPYAQPPVGDLRFQAPVAATGWNETFSATEFSGDCPCNRIPTHQAYIGGPAGEKILVALAQTNRPQDEDCLTVNVWTKPQSGEASKAVLLWIYGGGFSTGNSACPIYNGAILADEDDVVVVSLNYRLNIFGFSGAPDQATNVGILDQRLAIEWARDNVASFGGDPDRITVFGQSAGGASADLVVYGWPDDPIAHSIIPMSGVLNSVIGTSGSESTNRDNWYKASKNAGCGGEEAGDATVPCMQQKTWQEILDAIEPIGTNAIMSGFAPFPDNKVIPSDVQARGSSGQFAHIPALIGNTNNEAAFFIIVAFAYTDLPKEAVDVIPIPVIQPLLDLITTAGFTCPSSQAIDYRSSKGIPSWRYMYYGGNYSNTYVYPVGSNYHTADLPIAFDTAEWVTDVPDEDAEIAAGNWQRNAWATFAKNSTDGLSSLGWPLADSTANYIAQLSLNKQTEPTYTNELEIDYACPVIEAASGLGSTIQTVLTGITGALFNGTSNGTSTTAWNMLTELSKTGWSDVASLEAYIAGLQKIADLLNGVTLPVKRDEKVYGPHMDTNI